MNGLVLDYKSDELIKPVERFFELSEKEREILSYIMPKAWNRCMYCFEYINNPRFHTGGVYTLHTVQYSMYIYFLMNEIYSNTSLILNNDVGDNEDVITICDKLFSVNMALSGVDIYYGLKLPNIFCIMHTVGVVTSSLAQIGKYFVIGQGCNIGIAKGHAPVLGEGVIMYGNSKIIGNCHIGNHVIFGANSYIKDMDIPSNSMVFGQYPNITIKENREDQVMEYLSEWFIM